MKSKALTLAPGDVVADAGGFTRVGADGRVLVYNSADECPECGCGGGPTDACCTASGDDWASRVQGFRPTGFVGPCAVTPINPQRPALLDWCAGSLAGGLLSSVRVTMQGSGTITGRYARTNQQLLSRTLDLSWNAAPTQVTGRMSDVITNVVCAGSGGGAYSEIIDNGGGPVTFTDNFAIAAPRVSARMLLLTGGTRTHGFSGEYLRCDGSSENSTGFQAGWVPGLNEVVIRNTSGLQWPPGAFSPWDLQQLNSGGAVTLPGGWRWRVVRSYSVTREASGDVVATVTATFTQLAPGPEQAWDSLSATSTITCRITPLRPCGSVGALQGDTGPGDQPTRWLGLEWEGRPMPLRVVDRLLGRRVPTCGCGCIKPLKRAWRRLLAPAPHPATV